MQLSSYKKSWGFKGLVKIYIFDSFCIPEIFKAKSVSSTKSPLEFVFLCCEQCWGAVVFFHRPVLSLENIWLPTPLRLLGAILGIYNGSGSLYIFLPASATCKKAQHPALKHWLWINNMYFWLRFSLANAINNHLNNSLLKITLTANCFERFKPF